MKDFWIRAISVLLVVGVLWEYNHVLLAREKEDEIAKLNAKLEAAQMSYAEAGGIQTEETGKTTDSNEQGRIYRDGTYEGEADGFGGAIKVQVKVHAGRIEQIEIVSADNEDGAYLDMAKEIIPEMIEAQEAKADTVSGATFSSTGIKNATQQALEKAGN